MLELRRFANIPSQGMFGEIYWKGKFLGYTVEREWLDNKANVSCVPCGEYELVKHSGKYDSYALVGGTVSHYTSSQHKRSCILIHTANIDLDVEGCIGVGSNLGYVKRKWAVTNSRNTVQAVLNLIKKENIKTITIRDDTHAFKNQKCA
ncbi:DUF5675 family protein [Vibrio parahaemolyticus]|uniref:DUF5675 family protein n=1 Tax=Vibrio parahaemolyticus TaxID=670 RepID=UPI0006770B04|nr:DUF5675 family protein [Vibrio parahaemolyticus]